MSAIQPFPGDVPPKNDVPRDRAALHRLFAAADESFGTRRERSARSDTAAVPLPEPAPGERIGRYQLVRRLGEGGMGRVFEAHHDDGRRFAVKFLSEHLHYSPDAAERLRREAAISRRLGGRGLCRAHEVLERRGRPAVVFDYVDGTPLSELLMPPPEERRKGPPSWLFVRRRAAWIAQVAETADLMHREGVVHRDLKPSNIMVVGGTETVVLDFGLSVDVDCGSDRLTRTGTMLGTPTYMAPEQFARTPVAPDPRIDVYALGVVLYVACTGTGPFTGDTPAALMESVLRSTPVSPKVRNPNVPVRLAAACLHALERAPENRFASAAALAESIRRAL